MEYPQESPVVLTAQDNRLSLTLQGSIDIFVAEQLYGVALQVLDQAEDLVVHCEEVTQVGSAALQILLALKDGLRMKGKHVRFQGVSDGVMSQLRQSGLAGILLVEETEI